MRVYELPTPALLLDKSILLRNIDSMVERAQRHGVTLRPHLKTCKSADIAALFMERGVERAAVSTLVEAEYFIAAGIKDIQYAVCIAPDKFERVALLNTANVKLSVITDSAWVAKQLVEYANQNKKHFYVWIELDCGSARTGVKPHSDELLLIASTLSQCQYINIQGVMTHAGHAYDASSASEIETIAKQEVNETLLAKKRLQGSVADRMLSVSIGSTPTVMFGQDFTGIDEIRPGVFVFQDTFQWQLGVCTRADMALSVLATVISTDQPNNRFVIDAGGLALSKDRSTVEGKRDFGFGLVVDIDGNEFEYPLTVYSTHQEHGLICSHQPIDFSKIKIGSKVRVLPNHACMTAAAYNGYHIIEKGRPEIEAFWKRINGW